jgi:CHRD domain
MRKLALAVSVGLLGAVVLITTALANGKGGKSFRATLTGYEEIIPASFNQAGSPPFAGEAGAVSTTGSGKFTARVTSKDPLVIEYRLRYSNLEGTPTTQAHIHFGQKHTVGGVSVFLCGDANVPDPDPPNDIPNACTPVNGDIEGTITAADVIGPTGQGIEPGSIAELIRAMRNGTTYVNVHTGRWPGGEIRGQVNDRDDDD